MARKKKRGVKPGTKRGPYKRVRKRKAKLIGLDNPMSIKQYAELFTNNVTNLPRSNQSLADELDAAIASLEEKMKSATARINAILKVGD